MLSIRIDNPQQHSQHLHEIGDLLLGRQPSGTPSHVVINDEYVSRRHLMLRELSPDRVRVENLGTNALLLENGKQVQQGVDEEINLPAKIHVGKTLIHLQWDSSHPTSDLSPATLDTTASAYKTICGQPELASEAAFNQPLATLGTSPPPETLAQWLTTLANVQHSAVGSTALYQETADAVVRLVGLTSGQVILKRGEQWQVVAKSTARESVQQSYSTSVLEEVLAKKRTFYGNPQQMAMRPSLLSLEAVVGSPIFDRNRDVVGMLYGSREFTFETRERFEITPLEAQVVQMLASSISVGLYRQHMEEQLQQAQQLAAVGQALGFIIHDLRGPLGNTQQLVEMLRQGDQTTLSRDDQLDFVEDSVSVALSLLNDSLEFCRGQVSVTPVRGGFKQLFDKHLKLLRLSLEPYQVALKVEAHADLELMVDPDRMSRVFRNLTKNAAEALQGQPNATVTIGATVVQGTMQFWVADNGPGLPETVKEHLFQPFATHGKQGGTGFGLAIAKQLVEAHRGTIRVESNSTGTRFLIEIPFDATAAAHSSRDDINSMPVSQRRNRDEPEGLGKRNKRLQGYRVLLAEDNPINQKLAIGLLTKQGHHVEVVENGLLAIEALGAQAFDIVLMDVEMPGMGGIEATASIRDAERRDGAKRIAIVALTGHEDPQVWGRCREAGIDHCLAKPLNQSEVEVVFAELLKPC